MSIPPANQSNPLKNYPIIDELDDDIILTVKNISKLIKVHEETVRRWCRNGYVKTLSPFGAYKIRGIDFKNFVIQWYDIKDKHR
ncbi:helix-turn-helix domain-containing protein [Paenibacillus alkaliterrae]|uniref:helix-turn-helix domain-containing protein n=1 Tax=Paenibacillus alkaliterrae TaxID=320909 RepID=UPI001F28BAF5|nr:helix-turn-helix domain-containing protein [Paenibacillus alkaliterrae]MCF2940132.1 helix-turn-helix domain-containing protein [Paenibacillus alkaliterrae]